METKENGDRANLNAQRRRYDAVLETEPRTNSMAWIIW